MRSEREYTLLQYLPYTLVPFYPLFQERGAEKVERPKADWEVSLSHFTTAVYSWNTSVNFVGGNACDAELYEDAD